MHTLPPDPGNQQHLPTWERLTGVKNVVLVLEQIFWAKPTDPLREINNLGLSKNHILSDPRFYCITKGHTCLSLRIFPSDKQNTVGLCCSFFQECPCVLYLQGGHLAMIRNPWPLASHLWPRQTPKGTT